MNLSIDENNELEIKLDLLEKQYNTLCVDEDNIHFWCFRITSIGVILILSLIAVYIAGKEIHGLLVLLATTIGLLLLIYSKIYSHNKRKAMKKTLSSINYNESEIRRRYKLEYCSCDKGIHFYSPQKKQIWSTKHNIYFDSHPFNRVVPYENNNI